MRVRRPWPFPAHRSTASRPPPRRAAPADRGRRGAGPARGRGAGRGGPGGGDDRGHPGHGPRPDRAAGAGRGAHHPAPRDRPADHRRNDAGRRVRANAPAAGHLRPDGDRRRRVRRRAPRRRGAARRRDSRPRDRPAGGGGGDGHGGGRRRVAGLDGRRHEFAAGGRGGRRPAPQQRPQLPRPGPADAGGVDLAGPGRRRAQHRRPARHLQQHHRGRRRLQQSVLRRAAGRTAARVHLQPGRDRGDRGGQPGRDGRVRPLGRRLRQRDHQVGHERCERLGPLLWPMGRNLRRLPARARRRRARLRAQPVRRHPRRPPRARPRVLLPRLRPAGGGRDPADRAAGREPGRARPARDVPAIPVAGPVRRRVRAHPAHRRRPVVPRQGRRHPRRPPPAHREVQPHVGGAGERHLRRRRVGTLGQRDRGGTGRTPSTPASARCSATPSRTSSACSGRASTGRAGTTAR